MHGIDYGGEKVQGHYSFDDSDALRIQIMKY